MEDLKLNNKMLKIGKTSFNREALQDVSKEQFIETYKGKLSTDIEEAWQQVLQERKQNKKSPKMFKKAEK